MTDQQRRYLQRHFPDRDSRLHEILNKYNMYSVNKLAGTELDFDAVLTEAIGSTACAQSKLKKMLDEAKADSQYLCDLFFAYTEHWQYDGHDTYLEYLKSEHWHSVRDKAIDRAGGLCMLCNSNDGGLHVHHRTYERLGEEEEMDVIVLCAKHHAQFHGKDGGE